MPGIDHIDLVVSDLERSTAFYVELLAPLGYRDDGDIVGERGERVRYLAGPDRYSYVGLRERQSDVPHDRYALGLHHLAFVAPDRAAVDERAAWLDANGHEIESGPEEYDYSPSYYAVFFRDPDGLKLEIVHRVVAGGQ